MYAAVRAREAMKLLPMSLQRLQGVKEIERNILNASPYPWATWPLSFVV